MDLKNGVNSMVNFLEIILAILPFIFGIIAIGLIPKRRDEHEKSQPQPSTEQSHSVEKQVVIYMIGFFILVLGTYYFISSLFGEDVDNQRLIYIINGLFLGLVHLNRLSFLS